MTATNEGQQTLADLRDAVFLARGLAIDLYRALDLRAVDHDYAFEIARALDLNLGQAFEVACLLGRITKVHHNLQLAYVRAHALRLALARRDLVHPHDVSQARTRASEVDRTLLDVMNWTMGVLNTTGNGSWSRRELERQPTPARLAVRLLDRIVLALPGRARSRYREELYAELLDIAADGATRRAQLAHTLRLMTRMWSLRRASLAAVVTSRERAR